MMGPVVRNRNPTLSMLTYYYCPSMHQLRNAFVVAGEACNISVYRLCPTSLTIFSAGQSHSGRLGRKIEDKFSPICHYLYHVTKVIVIQVVFEKPMNF